MDKPTEIDEREHGTDEFEDTVTKVKNTLSETAGKAQEKLETVGRTVEDKIDENRGVAADKMQTAASKLHDAAESLPGGTTVVGLAHGAADKIEASAGYVRERPIRGMMTDLEHLIRHRPGQSLFVAAAFGFLLGRALKRGD